MRREPVELEKMAYPAPHPWCVIESEVNKIYIKLVLNFADLNLFTYPML
jgi:hypothetical protein